MSQLDIFIGVDENAKNLLIYLLKNLKKINTNNMRVNIKKVTKMNEKTVKWLESKGITRFPAMIDPNNKTHVGVSKIISVIDKNMGPKQQESGEPIDMTEIGSNSDLSSFWAGEMYAGKAKNGRMKPRKDVDEDEEDDDMDRKLRNYQRNVPKHRRTSNKDEDSDDEEQQKPKRRPRKQNDSDDEDNVASPPKARARQRGGGTDADMDERMLSAFMNNLGE